MSARDSPSMRFSLQGTLHPSPQAHLSHGKLSMCFGQWPVGSDCNQEEQNPIKH